VSKLESLFKIFSIKVKVDKSKSRITTELKKLTCFICGINFLFNEFAKHLNVCYKNKFIPVWDKISVILKTYLIEEILKEKIKGDLTDVCYIFYLIKEYNKCSFDVYHKILEEINQVIYSEEQKEKEKKRLEELSKSISIFEDTQNLDIGETNDNSVIIDNSEFLDNSIVLENRENINIDQNLPFFDSNELPLDIAEEATPELTENKFFDSILNDKPVGLNSISIDGNIADENLLSKTDIPTEYEIENEREYLLKLKQRVKQFNNKRGNHETNFDIKKMKGKK
jgi:hypothetical protein